MANGKVLQAYRDSIEKGNTVPQNVTNGLLLTALIELYGITEDILKHLEDIDEHHVLEGERGRDVVRGRQLWEDYGKEIVRYLIIAIVAYLAVRIGLIR